MEQLLKDCQLSKPITKKLVKMKITTQQVGNLTVPSAEFVSGLAREQTTQREQYVMLITSRWGIAFEVALFNREQMSTAMTGGAEGDLERAFSQTFEPDSYELINVYKLYDVDLEIDQTEIEHRAAMARRYSQQVVGDQEQEKEPVQEESGWKKRLSKLFTSSKLEVVEKVDEPPLEIAVEEVQETSLLLETANLDGADAQEEGIDQENHEADEVQVAEPVEEV